MIMETKTKIWKAGDGYVVTVPKQYIKDGIFYEGQKVKVMITYDDDEV